jgi:hypothetical protein
MIDLILQVTDMKKSHNTMTTQPPPAVVVAGKVDWMRLKIGTQAGNQ